MSAKRIIMAIGLGLVFGALGYLIFQNIIAGTLLGVVWCLAALMGKKQDK